MVKDLKKIMFSLLLVVVLFATIGFFYFKVGLEGTIEQKEILKQENLNIKNLEDIDMIAADSSLTSSVSGDLVTLSAPNLRYFYVNTSNSYSSSTDIKKLGGVTSTGKGYVSLKNGTYYFFSLNTNNMATISRGPVSITNSCSNESKTGQKGTFTMERCYVIDKSTNNVKPEQSLSINPCASGYKLTSTSTDSKDCVNKASNMPNGITKRYCKVVITGTCTEDKSGGNDNPGGSGGSGGGSTTVASAKLNNLSISSGTLSPAFKSGTKKYTATVESNVDSIKITATAASGSTFVSGYGSRTVKLKYGSNNVQVKVKNSKGSVVTYSINITRKDGRSTVNTLSSITLNVGTLSPEFSSSNTNYTIDVDNSITAINIGATLTDPKSKFVTDFGPKSYNLEPGPNKIYIKVANEKDEVNVYNIVVNRATTPSKCTTEVDSLALLKQLDLYTDIPNMEIDQLEFDPKIFVYNDIKLPYDVVNLGINPYVETDGDTFKIEGETNLEVGESREIKITVTSKDCPNFSNVYTLNVQRQEKKILSENSDLKSLKIDKHSEFEFQANQTEYTIILNKNEDKLNFTFETEEEEAQCYAEGNENLTIGSEITITCTAPDKESTSTYVITVDGIKKGTNMVLVVILIIIIVLILIYLVLRLLGYKIYFNFAAIGAFFRGIGEKFKNMFDK